MTALRWLLVPVAAVAAWAASVVTGLALHNGIQRLCPADQFMSGQCIAPWFPIVERIVFCASAALAAGLVVVACTLSAPDHRSVVAITALAIGAAAALAMAFAADAYLEFAAAVSAGLAACVWLRRRGWR